MMQIIIIGIIVALWVWGGQRKGRIRDIGCPIMLGIGVIPSLPAGDYGKTFVASIATIALANIIRLGYGNYDPENDNKPSFLASIIKDRQGAIIRLAWGLLVGIITPLALFFMHFMTLPAYIAYIVTNITVNYSISKFRFPILLADICVVGAFSSLLIYLS